MHDYFLFDCFVSCKYLLWIVKHRLSCPFLDNIICSQTLCTLRQQRLSRVQMPDYFFHHSEAFQIKHVLWIFKQCSLLFLWKVLHKKQICPIFIYRYLSNPFKTFYSGRPVMYPLESNIRTCNVHAVVMIVKNVIYLTI